MCLNPDAGAEIKSGLCCFQATGQRLATMFQGLASVGAGIAIGFAYSWKLTLLIVGFAPVMLASGAVQMKVMSGNKEANRAAMEDAGKVGYSHCGRDGGEWGTGI